jgi:hypothetical protein
MKRLFQAFTYSLWTPAATFCKIKNRQPKIYVFISFHKFLINFYRRHIFMPGSNAGRTSHAQSVTKMKKGPMPELV